MALPLVSTHSAKASLRTNVANPAPIVPVAGPNVAPGTALATQNRFSALTDPSKRTADFITGWNASHISPDPNLHSAAHSTLAPTAEQKTNLQAITNQVLGLNNPSLASRTVGSTQAPAGSPVGSASVSQGGSIPQVVQNAVNNLQANTQAAAAAPQGNSIDDLVNKILGSLGTGGGISDAQNTYYQNKNAIMAAPAQAQQQLASLAPQTAVSPFIQPMGQSNAGQIAATSAYQDANAAYGAAVQGAQSTGWTPYVPGGTPAAGSVTGFQMGGVKGPSGITQPQY